jgi:hypothetical protein
MRKFLVPGFALAFAATGAMAQTPPAQNGPQNSAINSATSSNRQVDAPVKGHNSFTESEAKSRIENQGFTEVSGLQKDDNGVWRGHAMKAGQQVDVALDFQGNVVLGAMGTTAPVMTPRSAAGR